MRKVWLSAAVIRVTGFMRDDIQSLIGPEGGGERGRGLIIGHIAVLIGLYYINLQV